MHDTLLTLADATPDRQTISAAFGILLGLSLIGLLLVIVVTILFVLRAAKRARARPTPRDPLPPTDAWSEAGRRLTVPPADPLGLETRTDDTERPIAIVTGGARRVGRAIAESLARAGCDLVLTYSRSAEEADRTADELAERHHATVHLHQVDLADPQQTESLGENLARDLPRADILVHNAAIYWQTPLAETGAEDALQLYRVNALAPLILSKHLAPRLAESNLAGAGSIVAFTDIHAIGRPRAAGFAAYSMSKAAIAEMVRSLARELAPRVRVNAVAPGVVAFPEQGYESDEESRQRYIAQVPLRRSGTPEDAAEAVRWLALDARYCTGQIIRVDGGRSLA